MARSLLVAGATDSVPHPVVHGIARMAAAASTSTAPMEPQEALQWPYSSLPVPPLEHGLLSSIYLSI